MSSNPSIGRVEEASEGVFKLRPNPREKRRPGGSRNRPSAAFRGTEGEAERKLARLYLADKGPNKGATYDEFWATTVDQFIESPAGEDPQ